MIRHVRRHFICFTMCILTGAVLLPMIALNVIPAFMSYNQNKTVLQQAVQNEIRLRSPKPSKQPDKQPSENDPFIPQTTTVVSGTTVSVSVTSTTTTTETTAGITTDAPAEQIQAPPETAVQGSHTKPAAMTTQPVMTKPAAPVVTTQNVQTRPNDPNPDYPPDDNHDNPPPYPDDWHRPPEQDPWWWYEHEHYNDENMSFNGCGIPGAAMFSYMPLTASLTTEEKKPQNINFPPKEEHDTDYFLAVLDQQGNMTETIQADWYDYTEEQVAALVAQVQKQNKQDGKYESLQYYAQDYQKGTIISFMDCSKDQKFLRQLLFISIVVFLLMESIVFGLTMMLTKRAMQPMQISFEKQKQFISDAGHELKTPLTIISANADILQDEIGENKWLDYIRMQTERMRILVDEMMTLTKMEHSSATATAERFNLSSAVETMALLAKDGDVIDKEWGDFTAEMYSEGHSFFTYMSDNADSLSSCCRLRNEIQDNGFSYTLGAGGVSTGSKSVLTINLNRCIQYAVNNKLDYKEYLSGVIDLCHKVQLAYNENLKELQKHGMLPLFDAGYINMGRQYLTIGVNGLVEAAEFMGLKITDNPDYLAFVQTVLGLVEKYNVQYRTKDVLFNCEMIPAENVGVKHAKWDREDGYFVPRDCYNSYFYVVEDDSLNIMDKFKMHGAPYIEHLTGGSALHMNLEEHLSQAQYRQLLRVAAKEGCNYFTFNIPNTICNDCGYIDKRYLKKCPHCGSENVDYMTRIIGYLKRVSNFSKARQQEASRRYYAEKNKYAEA